MIYAHSLLVYGPIHVVTLVTLLSVFSCALAHSSSAEQSRLCASAQGQTRRIKLLFFIQKRTVVVSRRSYDFGAGPTPWRRVGSAGGAGVVSARSYALASAPSSVC